MVVMPRLVAGGSGVLAVAVNVRWAAGVAVVAFVSYLTWSLWPRRRH